jgi:LacI family transcriptional regulator
MERHMETKRVILYIETSSGYGRNLLRGIVEYARCFGPWEFHRIPPFYYRDRQTRTHVLRKLAQWKPDGAIIREPRPDEDILKLKIPIIVSPSPIAPAHLPAVVTDDQGAGTLAARHLLERGFRNLGFCGYDDLYWSQKRGETFCENVKACGITPYRFTLPKKKGGYSPEAENHLLTQWLISRPKPFGLFACNDDRGSQIAGLCDLCGIRIPEQLAIVSADNDDLACSLTVPELSSVNFDTQSAGYQAAELLHRLMTGQETLCGQRILDQARSVTARGSTNTLAIEDELIAKAIGYIRRNIRNRATANDVVKAMDISRSDLYTRFKKELGKSIYRFITEEKIGEMIRLLKETNLTVRQIAYALGEQDDKNIARTFARITGQTPSTFRKGRT